MEDNLSRRPVDAADTTWLSTEVAGVILAGGQNSRMGGADKAFLTVDGETVVSRTLRLLRSCFPRVVIASNNPGKYGAFDVDVVPDDFRARGPLAGIHAAMGRVGLPYVFVVACDMPFIRRGPLAFLVERLSGQDAIIPCWEDDIEPLHGIYATRLRPRIGAALGDGVGAIRRFLPTIAAEYVAEESMRTVHGATETFRNINTPEEAARFAVRLNTQG